MRAAVLALACGCGGAAPVAGDASIDAEVASYAWRLPAGFPVPKVPADNPMSEAKVALGRLLFYDRRLSFNQTQACASCHQQALAFTDGRARAVGSTGVVNRRSAMSLANVAYYSAQTWANPRLASLEAQAAVPLFGENPVELGMAGHEAELLARLAAEPRYPPLFAAAFPDEPTPIAVANVVRAIAAFERTILSGGSPYDRYAAGDDAAISDAAKRGAALFLSERLECRHCHGTFALTGSVTWQGKSVDDLSYQNDALYNIDGAGGYPARDRGLYEVTLAPSDMGKFRPPTVRNVAVTAPYMHDGSIATLEEVLDHYAAGGRTIASGPYAGVGSDSPYKSELIAGFTLTPEERADVIAFLESLTDDALLTDPRFADPWKEEP